MKILMTGASGFIGGALVRQLDASYEVFAVGRSEPPRDTRARITWIEHDLAEPLDATALPQRVDAVLHLAQSRRYRDFPDGAADVFAVNVRTTFELLEYARTTEARRFMFASTGGLYGHGDEAFVEDDAPIPLDFYLASKHAAETLIANYAPLFPTVVLRFFFVYGPKQGPMVISSLARRVVAREPVVIVGDPGIRINPIYVDDAVAVLERAVRHEHSLLCNVAGAETISLTDLVRLIADVAGVDVTIDHAPAVHDGDILGDIARVRAELGFEPKIGLREGVARVVRALRADD